MSTFLRCLNWSRLGSICWNLARHSWARHCWNFEGGTLWRCSKPRNLKPQGWQTIQRGEFLLCFRCGSLGGLIRFVGATMRVVKITVCLAVFRNPDILHVGTFFVALSSIHEPGCCVLLSSRSCLRYYYAATSIDL